MIFCGVQVLEITEDFIGLLHAESAPVIFDEIHSFLIFHQTADFDSSWLALACLFIGIVDQIYKDVIRQRQTAG